jgi:hypothetical protein
MKDAVYRGSRKHILDWTSRPTFLIEIFELLRPVQIAADAETLFMPRGYAEPDEARLERFGPLWLPDRDVWQTLQSWWLIHKAGANTPNWDFALGCRIEGRPGLVLVEAKANWPELSRAGKELSSSASPRSHENHRQIGAAIAEASAGLQQIDPGFAISRDSHYQLANRLAYSWKLAKLKIPVVLLYLGFTGDGGISDVGAPFNDGEDWSAAFRNYTARAVPPDMINHRLDVAGTPMWVMVRSRPILAASSTARMPNLTVEDS